MDNLNNDIEFLKQFLSNQDITEEEITKRQQSIIDAAIKVFSEKGFEGSRTSDIAKEAGVAEGTIFRYYNTKKDILIGLLFPMISKFIKPLVLNSVERIIENKDNRSMEEVIEELFMDRIQLARKNLPLVKTVLVESAYHPELLEPLRNDITPKVITFIESFIDKNKQSGEFRDLTTRSITRTVISLLIGYVVLTNLYPNIFTSKNDKEQIEEITDIFLNGVINRDKDTENRL